MYIYLLSHVLFSGFKTTSVIFKNVWAGGRWASTNNNTDLSNTNAVKRQEEQEVNKTMATFGYYHQTD